MAVTLNRQLLTTTCFDSSSLGMLTSIIRQFEVGRYEATVLLHDRPIRQLKFEVSKDSELMQLDIDLAGGGELTAADAKCDCRGAQAEPLVVSPEGYVLIFASAGTDGRAILVHEVGAKGKQVFDSRELGAKDLFALSLLEPGRYSMENHLGKARGVIEVTLPPNQAKRLRIQEQETQGVEVSLEAIDPKEVRTVSTQGIVFSVVDRARIVVERQKSSGDHTEKRPPIRFTRPGAAR